jgi:hypothetical protein
MRRVTILMLAASLLVALVASVAVAKTVRGTNGPDTLRGTNEADTLNGRGGADEIYARGGADLLIGGDDKDRLYGQDGNDTLKGGFGGELALRGGAGNDVVRGDLGGDTMTGDAGDDTMLAGDDTARDFINCGGGFDVAMVSLNDVVGGASVRQILSSVSAVDQPALSCEVLVVDGLRVPLGAIVALPAPLESDVSLLLEAFLRDGELSPDEVADLREVFALILQIDEEDDPGALEQLLGDLGALLDGLLGGILG